MLVPKQRLQTEYRDGQSYCIVKYSVWDTDDCAYVETEHSPFMKQKKNARNR